jgi:hypothetical protein
MKHTRFSDPAYFVPVLSSAYADDANYTMTDDHTWVSVVVPPSYQNASGDLCFWVINTDTSKNPTVRLFSGDKDEEHRADMTLLGNAYTGSSGKLQHHYGTVAAGSCVHFLLENITLGSTKVCLVMNTGVSADAPSIAWASGTAIITTARHKDGEIMWKYGSNNWALYTAPVNVPAGNTIYAAVKACGFSNSATATLSV